MRFVSAFTTKACCLWLAGAMLGWSGCDRRPRDGTLQTKLSLQDTLGAQADDGRFEHALAPRTFTFPRDHRAHTGFRNEWWYWTGNLAGPAGRRFGYQLTIFRTALGAPLAAARSSAWATEQAYMAHFTVTELGTSPRASSFHAFERLSRGAVGLAGATATDDEQPFAVWVLDWSAQATGAADAPFAVRLRARDSDVAIDLQLDQGKPPVLQGAAGLSQKGTQPGNASYYYSLTRMPTRGVMTVQGDDVAVLGLSWMDREWSTSALEPGQSGWDWFSVQLDDGRDLMFFRLRRADGSVDEHSHGSLVDAGGHSVPLDLRDVRIEVLATWTSAASGTTYPARFRLTVQKDAGPLVLEITPARQDQELEVSFRYWEGAVVVQATDTARSGSAGSIAGRGYVELTGYDTRSDDPR